MKVMFKSEMKRGLGGGNNESTVNLPYIEESVLNKRKITFNAIRVSPRIPLTTRFFL